MSIKLPIFNKSETSKVRGQKRQGQNKPGGESARHRSEQARERTGKGAKKPDTAATNYLTGDKQVPSAPAKLYHVSSGRLSHMILMSILVSRMALNFTMHAAGNELILFYCYRSNYHNFFYHSFLPLPRNYRRNLPIYHDNTVVTMVLPLSPLPCHSLFPTKHSLKILCNSKHFPQR